MKFIDLFAGLGGFHKALHELGHECVFASELDPVLRDVYKKNWGNNINIHGDIRKIVKDNINLISLSNFKLSIKSSILTNLI